MKKNMIMLATVGIVLFTGSSALYAVLGQTVSVSAIGTVAGALDDISVDSGLDYLTPLDELKRIAGNPSSDEETSVGDLLDRLYVTADDIAFLQVEDDKKQEIANSELAQKLLSIFYLAQAQDNQSFIAAMQAYQLMDQILPLPIEVPQ
jgi:hypothetical protein